MTQNQIKCIHCDKWVDKHLCHVSHICPYCGARMDIPPKTTPKTVDVYDEDDRDPGLDVVGTILDVAAVVAETVFDDQTNDPYAGDDDPSGGGSFGGGGADDSW